MEEKQTKERKENNIRNKKSKLRNVTLYFHNTFTIILSDRLLLVDIGE